MRSMHDKRQAPVDTPNQTNRPLETLIAELEASDPAAAPDIADEIAARLEADLAAASADAAPRQPVAEQFDFAQEAADTP